MNILSMKYPKKSKAGVNKVFWYLKNLNKELKRFEDENFMGNLLCTFK